MYCWKVMSSKASIHYLLISSKLFFTRSYCRDLSLNTQTESYCLCVPGILCSHKLMLLWRYHRQIAEQSSFQFDQNTLKKKALFSQPSWVQHNSRNSVQFSHSVMSYSVTPWTAAWPGLPVHHQLLEFTRLSDNNPTISSCVIPFSSHIQSFPPSGSFQMSQFFTSGGQSTGVFSFSVSPSNEHPGLIFQMDSLDLIAL